MLMVDIIGVTLFFEKDENKRHNDATVIITKFENKKPKPNLQITS